MAEVVALEFALDAGKANMTLGELEEGFESMQKKLRTVGRGSEEFKTLTTAMAGTSAEIKNIELSFEGLDKEQIASELGGLAGGIGDVTASLVLMGGENETIEQIGATIEKAMAISMGFKGAIEGAAAANKLYNNSVRAQAIAAKIAAVAQKALNAVMKANPIALIVAGITAAVVAYKSFSKESKKASFAQDAFTSAANEAQIATISQKIELNKLIKVAKDDTLSKRQRQAAIEDLNKLAPDYLGNLTLETINTKEATAAIGAYVAGLERKARATVFQNKLVEIETELIEMQQIQQKNAWMKEDEHHRLSFEQGEFRIKQVTEKKQAILDLMDAENNQTDAYVGNSAEKDAADKAAADAKKEADKAAKLLKDKAAADDKAETSRRKTASDKRTAQKEKDKAEAEKAAADAKLLAEKEAADAVILAAELIKTLDDLEAKAITDKNIRALAEQELAHTRAKESLRLKHGENKELEFALDAAQLVERNALDDSIEKEAIDKEAERVAAATAIEDEARKTKAAKDKAQREKDFALATAAVGALSALNSAALATDLLNAAGDEAKKEKLRKASFEREKKLNIAMALINGAQAVLAGFAQGGLPMAILAGVTAAAQLAAIVATTYQGGAGAGVETPTQEPSPDGAGAGGRGAQINAVSNTSTLIGDQNVTVTETDITSTQNKVKVIEESATF